MATDTPSTTTDQTERCPECQADRPHTVTVEIRTESDDATNAEFSREPYRIATCLHCEHERVTRMNNVTPG